jgi:DNA polymerase-1
MTQQAMLMKVPNEYKTLNDFDYNYILVDNTAKVQELLSKLSTYKEFTFDTETSGTETGSALEFHSLELVGISFAFIANEAYYLPVPQNMEQAHKLLEPFKLFFENPAIAKTGHNLKYDINVLRRYDIFIKGELFDTMIAHYLIDVEARHGLKEVSKQLFNYQQIEIQDLIGSGRNQLSMREVSPEDACVYACEDAGHTLNVRNRLAPILEQKGLNDLFKNVEMPLVAVIADMEYAGINIDYDTLLQLSEDAENELETLKSKIVELADTDFNISSNRDLGEVLFEILNLNSVTLTKTGDYSVSKKTLEKLKYDHAIMPLIIKYKSVTTIKNTFLNTLGDFIHPITERIHTNFKQARVVTGRLSSANPNLQNIPKQQDGFGREIRKLFIPRDKNHVIVSADYSQVELRIIAHYSKDTAMVESFNNGKDIHTSTAAKVFGVDEKEITKDDKRRKVAKAINFGLNYLMSADTLAERISDETGEEKDVNKAKEYVESYFDGFPKVREYQEDAYYLALVNGYSTTLLSRRREIKNIDSVSFGKRMAAKRKAANAPIQGSAADIIKLAMVKLFNEFNNKNLSSKMVLQIHDELVFDVPKDELDVVIPLIKNIMENVITLNVPLLVEIGVGENWFEAH